MIYLSCCGALRGDRRGTRCASLTVAATRSMLQLRLLEEMVACSFRRQLRQTATHSCSPGVACRATVSWSFAVCRLE